MGRVLIIDEPGDSFPAFLACEMNALNVLNGRGDLVKSVDMIPHLTPKRAKRRDKESYKFMDAPLSVSTATYPAADQAD